MKELKGASSASRALIVLVLFANSIPLVKEEYTKGYTYKINPFGMVFITPMFKAFYIIHIAIILSEEIKSYYKVNQVSDLLPHVLLNKWWKKSVVI